ncbi:MAG TPA: hypothetical protein VJC11_02315 [Patescibacteria group bacterium]|nr:hypothetical protein [Patescibacteria group bacterium]
MKKIYFAVEAVDIDHALFFLIDSRGSIIAKQRAQFRPRNMKLLGRIVEFFKKHQLELSDIAGIISVTGPGSFTSIRSTLSIVNTWAGIASVPIVGISRNNFSTPGDFIKKGLNLVQKTKKPKIITPFYGALPRITAPRKRG